MRIEGPSGPTPQQPAEQTYRTQPGDTIRLVGSKFNVDPNMLKRLNNLTQELDDGLNTGVELKIPTRESVDALINPDPSGFGSVTDELEKIAERVNPFEEEVDSKVADPYDDPWSEWDPYDPDSDWGERAPDKIGDIINPADLINKKLNE